jgi:hypothetical protein
MPETCSSARWCVSDSRRLAAAGRLGLALAKLGDPTIMARMTPIKRWSSADLNAAIAHVTPDVLALLGDGVPRTEAEIIAALAGQHSKDDVTLTVMRLDVVGRLDLQGSRYTLPAAEAEQG